MPKLPGKVRVKFRFWALTLIWYLSFDIWHWIHKLVKYWPPFRGQIKATSSVRGFFMHARKILLAFLCLLIFSHFVPLNACLAETAVIKVNYRDASEVLPMVEAFLSQEGRATVDVRTNSIMISDESESLKKIREFLAHIDKPAEQVTIRFRFQEEGISRERDMSASGTVSDDKWSVSAGKDRREGLHVRAQDRSVSVARNVESFITVLSGSAAYIGVGEEIPYTEKWIHLCGRYAHFDRRVDFKTIETGMEVTPVVSGDRVHIEIMPRISYKEPGDRGVIRFTEALTRVTVSKGEWVNIGGHGKSGNEVIREILSRRSADDRTSVSLLLKVEP